MAGKRKAVPQVPGEAPAEQADNAVETVERGAGLPDQSEIDPTTITRKVLTKQGWVFPEQKPGPQFAKG